MIGKLEVGVIVFLVLAVAGIFAFGQLADIQHETTRISGQRILIDEPNAFINVTDGSDWTKLSVGNHTITSYNSTYDVGMYWWCNNSNWTLVTE